MAKDHDPDSDDNQDNLFRKLMLNDKNFKPLKSNNKVNLPVLPERKKLFTENNLNYKRTRDFSPDLEDSNSTPSVPLSFHLSQPNVSAEEYISYFKVGLQNKTIKQLKNGVIRIEASLDLHAMTQEQASFEFSNFITRCYARGLRCVCIVHGKGTRSNQAQPILKNLVNNWLYEFSDIILGFCSCPPKNGGTGAVLVLFKAQNL